jgi:ABC-type transport system involved in multi-copper enzyme maturation permease subunit
MVIAKTHLLTSLKSRPFLGLLLVSWARFIYYAVRIYVASVSPQGVPAMFSVSAELFEEFLSGQGIFVFLITIAQAGVIADDRRANALQLYLSKPLTRIEYVTGKLVPPMIWLLGVTWLPAMVLLVLQVVFSGSFTFLREHLFLLQAITLFTAGMYQALRGITGSRAWAAISPSDMVDVITTWVFRGRAVPPVPVPVAVAVIVGLVILSVIILERRIRAVEVVA